MKEYKINKKQAVVLIVEIILTVGLILVGIVMRLNKGDSEFKPMDTFPPVNVAEHNNTDDKGVAATSAAQKPAENNNTMDLIPPESTTILTQNDQVQAEGHPSGNENTAQNTTVKPTESPVSKPTSKPLVDMPKDKPDSKPSTTKGDSKLVPDSENPFKQPPKVEEDGLGNVKGSDFYQNGVPAGQGDKF